VSFFVLAAVAAATLRQGPANFKAVPIPHTFITGNHHSFGQVHLKSNARHDTILGKKIPRGRFPSAIRSPDDKITAASGKPEITRRSHLKAEEPSKPELLLVPNAGVRKVGTPYAA
jgi:hypothetical protein